MNDLNDNQVQALARVLDIQDRDHDKEGWVGVLWSEAHTAPAMLNGLVSRGFLSLSQYSSRAYKYYLIDDPDKIRKIVDNYQIGSLPSFDNDEPLIVPQDLFDIITLHERVKNVLKLSLLASDPVHVLLVGEPATAKSLFLNELARLPGSRFALGGTSSRAGIVDFLIDARPRFLIIDEIEKADQRDMDVLLSLMEDGKVVRLKRGMRENVTLRTWVYAGANDSRRISAPLRDRFVTRTLPTYTQQEFDDVTRNVLIKREGMPPDWANRIVDKIRGKTLSPRDAVKVARMMKDISQLDEIVGLIL